VQGFAARKSVWHLRGAQVVGKVSKSVWHLWRSVFHLWEVSVTFGEMYVAFEEVFVTFGEVPDTFVYLVYKGALELCFLPPSRNLPHSILECKLCSSALLVHLASDLVLIPASPLALVPALAFVLVLTLFLARSSSLFLCFPAHLTSLLRSPSMERSRRLRPSDCQASGGVFGNGGIPSRGGVGDARRWKEGYRAYLDVNVLSTGLC